MVIYSPSGFDPVKCYEQLRFNIFEDPLYASRSRYLIEKRGMYWWFTDVEMLNSQLYTKGGGIDPNLLSPFYGLRDKEGFRGRLSILLAEIVLNIYGGEL